MDGKFFSIQMVNDTKPFFSRTILKQWKVYFGWYGQFHMTKFQKCSSIMVNNWTVNFCQSRGSQDVKFQNFLQPWWKEKMNDIPKISSIMSKKWRINFCQSKQLPWQVQKFSQSIVKRWKEIFFSMRSVSWKSLEHSLITAKKWRFAKVKF